MSEKNSIAARKRWSGIPKAERSRLMGDLVKKRHSKMTKEQRSQLAKRLVKAREKKRRLSTAKS